MKTQLLMILLCLTAAMGIAAVKFAPAAMVRHVVVFKYKTGATAEDIQRVTDAFRSLKDKIPGIVSFEHGVNNSPEKLNKGFTHVYLLTFESAVARDAYLPHPEHKKFGELLGKLQVLEEPFVIDYTVE